MRMTTMRNQYERDLAEMLDVIGDFVVSHLKLENVKSMELVLQDGARFIVEDDPTSDSNIKETYLEAKRAKRMFVMVEFLDEFESKNEEDHNFSMFVREAEDVGAHLTQTFDSGNKAIFSVPDEEGMSDHTVEDYWKVVMNELLTADENEKISEVTTVTEFAAFVLNDEKESKEEWGQHKDDWWEIDVVRDYVTARFEKAEEKFNN